LNVKRCAAVATEDARDVVAGIRLGDVALGRAVHDAELRRRHAHRRDMRRAALALAVAAMALQRELRLAVAFVAYCATQASAGSRGHGSSSGTDLSTMFKSPMDACKRNAQIAPKFSGEFRHVYRLEGRWPLPHCTG